MTWKINERNNPSKFTHFFIQIFTFLQIEHMSTRKKTFVKTLPSIFTENPKVIQHLQQRPRHRLFSRWITRKKSTGYTDKSFVSLRHSRSIFQIQIRWPILLRIRRTSWCIYLRYVNLTTILCKLDNINKYFALSTEQLNSIRKFTYSMLVCLTSDSLQFAQPSGFHRFDTQ